MNRTANRLVSEILSIKVADTQTDTSTKDKGRLKLAVCERVNTFLSTNTYVIGMYCGDIVTSSQSASRKNKK